ncbi:uncharacterized protein METZ01_LOCUS431400, partial [marine metagenome]
MLAHKRGGNHFPVRYLSHSPPIILSISKVGTMSASMPPLQ